MDTLTLKLVMTPTVVGTASLAGRRWGPGVGGWLVGLPVTSGPIALYLALDHGPAFGAAAAAGVLAGTIAQAAFCLAYSTLGVRSRWPLALLAGSGAFALAALGAQRLADQAAPSGAPLSLLLAALAALTLALRLLPTRPEPALRAEPPGWDLPARLVVATALVLLVTGLAPMLGPRLSGMLGTFPIYGGTLAIFGQRSQGPASAVRALRGLLYGLYGFAGFFFVLATLIQPLGTVLAFASAIAVALALQAASLWLLRRARRTAADRAPAR